MNCAIEGCKNKTTEGAHVKPRSTFKKGEDDRTDNIIRLCPSHHTDFDAGLLGIDQQKNRFIGIEKGRAVIFQSNFDLKRIRRAYVDEKNGYSKYPIKLWLGLIKGASYAKLP